jgi:hypothetical protein
MKRVIIVLTLFVTSTLFIIGQAQVTKKLLLSLQPGEVLQTNESCIELSYTANQLYVVARKGDNIFVYEGGQRKGPFNMDAVQLKNCGDKTTDQCAVCDPDQPDMGSGIISYTETGGMAINFKGKTYGPYKFVTAMHMPADKSWFIALVVKDGKYLVVSSDGTTQVIEGNGNYLHVSCSGKKYMVVCKEGAGTDAAMLDIDYSTMTQEKMMEMVQKQAEKQKGAGTPQAYMYTTGGKKFGPYPANEISENNPAFCKTSGENWYMFIDNFLYVNGEKIKQISTDDINAHSCNVWLSSDGKRYAIVAYDKILFSDGVSFPFPIKVDIENKEGKTYIKWISYENEKDLVLYSKEL